LIFDGDGKSFRLFPGHLPVSLLPSASPQHTSKHFSESCVDNSDIDSKLSVLTFQRLIIFPSLELETTTIPQSAYKMQLTFACGEFWLNGKVMDTIIMKDFSSFRHNLKYKMTLLSLLSGIHGLKPVGTGTGPAKFKNLGTDQDRKIPR